MANQIEETLKITYHSLRLKTVGDIYSEFMKNPDPWVKEQLNSCLALDINFKFYKPDRLIRMFNTSLFKNVFLHYKEASEDDDKLLSAHEESEEKKKILNYTAQIPEITYNSSQQSDNNTSFDILIEPDTKLNLALFYCLYNFLEPEQLKPKYKDNKFKNFLNSQFRSNTNIIESYFIFLCNNLNQNSPGTLEENQKISVNILKKELTNLLGNIDVPMNLKSRLIYDISNSARILYLDSAYAPLMIEMYGEIISNFDFEQIDTYAFVAKHYNKQELKSHYKSCVNAILKFDYGRGATAGEALDDFIEQNKNSLFQGSEIFKSNINQNIHKAINKIEDFGNYIEDNIMPKSKNKGIKNYLNFFGAELALTALLAPIIGGQKIIKLNEKDIDNAKIAGILKSSNIDKNKCLVFLVYNFLYIMPNLKDEAKSKILSCIKDFLDSNLGQHLKKYAPVKQELTVFLEKENLQQCLEPLNSIDSPISSTKATKANKI